MGLRLSIILSGKYAKVSVAISEGTLLPKTMSVLALETTYEKDRVAVSLDSLVKETKYTG